MSGEGKWHRFRYLPVPFFLMAWSGFVYALFTWPVWTAGVVLVTLISGTFYLALFVWPKENP